MDQDVASTHRSDKQRPWAGHARRVVLEPAGGSGVAVKGERFALKGPLIHEILRRLRGLNHESFDIIRGVCRSVGLRVAMDAKEVAIILRRMCAAFHLCCACGRSDYWECRTSL